VSPQILFTLWSLLPLMWSLKAHWFP
jgi:hypothetical protein